MGHQDYERTLITLLGRPMLFTSGVITAVLKFQQLKLLASRALPSVWDKRVKKKGFILHDKTYIIKM
jgi:hypothetical protein